MFLSCRLKTLGRFFGLLFALVFYCEFLHYYLVLLHCTWPRLSPLLTESFEQPYSSLRVMVLADVHLLGSKQGHWFDKLRREWQMERSFQTAMTIHHPDVVFVLGDLLDEGKWCSNSEFESHVTRFKKIFRTPSSSKMHVVVGNHDIGFHYMVTREKNRRFEKALNSPSVQVVRVKQTLFVLVNSIAMEGDGCDLCEEAESKLQIISDNLHCAQSADCEAPSDYVPYTRPILLQHFPLFRQSDSNCSLPDGPTPESRFKKLKSKFDCLSKTATKKLLKWLDPRLVISGHTHYGCFSLYNGVPEWTVSSFNWRNRKDPAFLLMKVNGEVFSINQCFLPNEDTVILMYILGTIFILIVTVLVPKIFNANRVSKFS